MLMNPGIWPSDTISLCRLARKSLAGMNWRRKTILLWSDLIMISLRKSRSRLKFLFDETTTLAALHLVFTRLVTFSASRVKLFLSFARAPSHQAHQVVFQLALALYWSRQLQTSFPQRHFYVSGARLCGVCSQIAMVRRFGLTALQIAAPDSILAQYNNFCPAMRSLNILSLDSFSFYIVNRELPAV